jgi:hypothetical protein
MSVLCKAYASIDRGHASLLGMLDLSAAFDTVDHTMLLGRLSSVYGLSGSVHAWMVSFLTDRTQTVFFDGLSSRCSSLNCDVPQVFSFCYTHLMLLSLQNAGISLYICLC